MDIALVFIFGLFLGSFYNVVAMRTLKGENIAMGRSHCTVCNHVLGALDLVPVFSYIFLGEDADIARQKFLHFIALAN